MAQESNFEHQTVVDRNRTTEGDWAGSFRFIDEFKNAAIPVNVIYSQSLGYLDGNHSDYFGSDRISTFRSDPQSISSTPTPAGMSP